MNRRYALIFFLLPLALWGDISYTVRFEGLQDQKTLKTIRSLSQLMALRKKPPSSVNALRFRAESDIPELTRALQAAGYLEAQVSVHIEEEFPNYTAVVEIEPGPLYGIDSYKIRLVGPHGDQESDAPLIDPEMVGISGWQPATTSLILESELNALNLLSQLGFPLATFQNREIVASGKTKGVVITITIDTGPLSLFGDTTIIGNDTVCSFLIEQSIGWCRGIRYDSCLVDSTQGALMDTGLFSSVYVTHDKELRENGELPMRIEVSETKHKSVSLGASYQTTYGPGAVLGWENRNINGLGRKLSLQADISQRAHSGIATFLVPNFRTLGQSMIYQAQAAQESIKPYTKHSYSFLTRFDKQINPYVYFSVGPRIEYMRVSSSVDNGNFLLLEAPLYLRWSNVSDFLNPESGFRFDYRGTFAVNVQHAKEFYYSQVAMLCTYLPIGPSRGLVLAQKITLGTIFSNGLGAVPVPNRFFGGSEDNLRGYRYFTVSPLNEDGKPIGGRSALYYSFEPRFRLSEMFGVVPFFDIGNVYSESLPNFEGEWRKSVGIGLRYFSFFGPLRLDVAFPLDRRKGLDPRWWIFVSVGQTF